LAEWGDCRSADVEIQGNPPRQPCGFVGIKHAYLTAAQKVPMKMIEDIAAPSHGRKKSEKAIRQAKSSKPTNGVLTNGHANGENFETLEIEEQGKVNGKARFEIHSKSVINDKSLFEEKLLCDGLTFTAGHACTFGCTFCFVPGMLWGNKRLNHIKRTRGENIIVEIADAPMRAREFLTTGGDPAKPRFKDPNDRRVIYGSPLVDVAGTMEQVKVTVGICLEILQLTHWQIRLLSKSALLMQVARKIPDQYKGRMIYGFSTGTLDSDLAATFEIGTGKVSKRLEALKWLQDNGYRTFGMLCPILPQTDYSEFARQVAATPEFDRCEHIWAEVLNERGGSLSATSQAIRKAGWIEEADLLDTVAADKETWKEYAEQTFLALSKVIPADKLRFLQYTSKKAEFERWEKHQETGAVLLGIKLAEDESTGLAKSETVVLENIRQFADVVCALKEIKDNKWYREYRSFENYCRAKFDFGRAQSYRLLQAAEVVDSLKQEQKSPIGDYLLPSNEAQARELARIKMPKERLEVLKRAVENPGQAPLNARLIRQAAMELKPVPPKPASATFYTPQTYTTDLKIFLGWIANLKDLAESGKRAELVKLLEKTEQAKSINPEMDVFTFTSEDFQNGWLSSLSEHDVEYKGRLFTVEGLYHWLRFEGHPEIQSQLAEKTTPEEALQEAMSSRHLLLEPDEKTAVGQMRQCLRLKIEQHPNLIKKLLATGDKVLVMDCTANPQGDDFFWGMAKINNQWVGENWLGKLWMELRAEKPKVKPVKLAAENKYERLRLYGKNRSKAGDGKQAYWTNIGQWIEQRRRATKRRPFNANVTSNGAKTEFNFPSLSPMLMGPEIECYRENGRVLKSVSVEVAWQYSKVYSHVLNEETGLLEDLKDKFITRKAGNDYPSSAWFAWRDKAYSKWAFNPANPDMDKDGVRRGFPRGSTVAFWYWAGEVIFDRAEARKRIYTALYQKHLLKTPAFHKLREIFNGSADEPARDLKIFDFDGYDWLGLDMTPTECLLDEHSFGHGLVISLNLLGIDPTKIEQKPADEKIELNVNWRDHYDSYDWKSGKQLPINARRRKTIEDMAADVLGLDPADIKPGWGVAHPPGCFAQTVIAVNEGLRHRYARHGKVGLKVFNFQRGMNEWGRLKRFYADYKDKLPGLKENDHVQKVHAWGTWKTAYGVERPYLVQEWIDGKTVDSLVKNGISLVDILRVLDDLFLKLLIPLWGQGMKWWDARRSNYVLHPKRGLVMIDPDTLADFAEEIATTPDVYAKRNTCNADEAISRYTTLIMDMALTCSDGKPARSLKKDVRSLCVTRLDPLFRITNCPYPLPPDWKEKATAAYLEFRETYKRLITMTK
jgi:hypothetical protein